MSESFRSMSRLMYCIPKEFWLEIIMIMFFHSIKHKCSKHLKIEKKLSQYCAGIKSAII